MITLQHLITPLKLIEMVIIVELAFTRSFCSFSDSALNSAWIDLRRVISKSPAQNLMEMYALLL